MGIRRYRRVAGSNMIFAVIPARGGSKRLPRKNLREIGGKTLVAWAIESARAATRLDEIVVSTDDNAIVQEAARLRCAWILRPEYLAQDETPTLPVLLHAVQFYPASTVIVTLTPTDSTVFSRHRDRRGHRGARPFRGGLHGHGRAWASKRERLHHAPGVPRRRAHHGTAVRGPRRPGAYQHRQRTRSRARGAPLCRLPT